eukprot:Hpha_TRINITY_DN16497_c0_g2::TRINITY_DN16497_c0_g2_i1::g.161106::m.161106
MPRPGQGRAPRSGSATRCTLVACNTETACLRFLILNAPTPSILPEYIEDLRAHGVAHLVRACVKTYDAKPVENAGIKVHDWPFPDGSPPPDKVLEEWLDLVQQVCKLPDEGIVAKAKGGGGAAGRSTQPHPLGLVNVPTVEPVCPVTRSVCTTVKIEEIEPVSKPKCSGCKGEPEGETVWRCDASGFTLCRQCNDLPYTQQSVLIGEGGCVKKGTLDETLGITIKGTAITAINAGGWGERYGLERGMNVRRIGDTDLWPMGSRKEMDQAFTAQPAPFSITFQLDYVLPCIGIHCIAGLGRAPVLVAVALVRLAGIESAEAIKYIRERRSGCFNTDQVSWLMTYKKKKDTRCCQVQ